MDALDIIRRLGQKENSLSSREFVSPVFHTNTVVTLIDGIVHKLKIPAKDPGWYVLKAVDLKKARIIGEANLEQFSRYLKHLKKIHLVLVSKEDEFYQALPLKNNNAGLDFVTPVPVYLATDFVDIFDTIFCGFDGANLWYWASDLLNDPMKTEYLRTELGKFTHPDKIRFKGLRLEEKMAYALRYSMEAKKKVLTKEESLKKDVEHAGGEFLKFNERKDHYSVSYKVDGQEYTSYVSKDPAHHVLTAGICLSGGDRNFDLASLITVLREGQRRRLIHRFHNTRD